MRCRLPGILALLLAGALSLTATNAFGHSGGTNAAGCHTNHRTGIYHCHTQKSGYGYRSTYCHVIRGEYRCGYARGM